MARDRDISVIGGDAVSVHLLGRPQIRREGAAVELPTKNCWLLLARLAVEGPQSRELLSSLLWPDADAERGRTNLRRTVAYVRDACGRGLDVVIGDRDSLGLADGVEADVRLVRRALDHPLQRADLMRAIGMWRGDFLDGVFANGDELDGWLMQQRQAWHQRLSLACERLASLLADAGAVDEALTVVDRWLSRDPVAELAHRQRVRLHIIRGDRTAALEAHARAVEVLAREVGVRPSEELRELETLARAAAAPSAPSTRLEVPMVGRQREHALLTTAFRHAQSREPSLALVIGEAGIGKSRLVAEFCSWCRAQGGEVVSARTFPSARRVPYVAVTGAFGDVVPALSRRSSRSVTQMDLVEALTGAVLDIAARSPLVVVVDDLHWVDPDSLELLAQVSARVRQTGARVLIVAALRDDEYDGSTALREWTSRCSRELRLIEVLLQPLTEEQTTALVDAWPGDVGEVALPVVRAAAGRPLLIVESLRYLEDGGDPAVMAPAAREFVHLRLRDLRPIASSLAEAAAALEEDADLLLLQEVAGLRQRDAQDALQELLRKRILAGSAHYGFSHDLLRRAVYAEMSGERRRRLHARAAASLDRRGAPASEVARHAELSGKTQLAWERRVAAATEASRVGAHRVAADQLRSAIAIRPEDTAAWLSLGRAEELSGRPDFAADTYRRLVERARGSGRSDAEAAGLVRLAELAGRNIDVAPPTELLADAADAAREAADEALAAEAALAAAQGDAYRGNVDAAEQIVEDIEERARTAGNAQLLARSLNLRAFINQQRGRWREALHLSRESQDMYRSLGDHLMELDSLGYELAALVFLGEWREAVRRSRRALDRAERIQNPWAVSNISLVQAWALRDGGQLDEARTAAARGRHAAEAAPFLPLQVLNAAVEGRCMREQGDVRAALTLHMQFVAATRSMDGVAHQCLTEEVCANYAACGEWDQAAHWARESASRWSNVSMFAYLGVATVAEALLGAGETVKLPPLPDTPRYDVVRWRAEAVIAARLGRAREAAALRRRALAVATRLVLPIEVRDLRLDLESDSRPTSEDSGTRA